MKYKVTKGKDSTAEFKITLDKKEWQEAIEKAYQKNKGKYSFPGFRKGKAPKKVIENAYGTAVFYEDAINICFYDYFYQAVEKEKDLTVVGAPDIDVENISDDGVTLIAKAPLKPEFELPNYKGITINKTEYNVLDEDIEGALKELQEKNSRLVEVTGRAAQNGDTVTINYSGSVNGVKFQGGAAEKQQLVLGSKSFIPGFEEQVAGMEIGAEKDINVKFPADYHAKELAGKDAVFAIKLLEIRVKELPGINDQLVKDGSEYESIKEFKAKTREKLEAKNKERAERETEDKLVKAIADGCDFAIPQVMIESEVDRLVQNMQYSLMYQGLKIEDYLKHTNQTMDKLKKSFEPQAKEQVKTQLIISKIIDAENITADEESLNKKIESAAKEMDKDVEAYKKEYLERVKDRFENEVIIEKLFSFLKENNNIK